MPIGTVDIVVDESFVGRGRWWCGNVVRPTRVEGADETLNVCNTRAVVSVILYEDTTAYDRRAACAGSRRSE